MSKWLFRLDFYELLGWSNRVILTLFSHHHVLQNERAVSRGVLLHAHDTPSNATRCDGRACTDRHHYISRLIGGVVEYVSHLELGRRERKGL